MKEPGTPKDDEARAKAGPETCQARTEAGMKTTSEQIHELARETVGAALAGHSDGSRASIGFSAAGDGW